MDIIGDLIADTLIKQKNYSSLDQTKIRFGVQLILSELYKLAIVYGVAFILGYLIPTFITHLSFYILRQVSFGYHFSNYISCIIWSIIAFPIMVIFVASIPLQEWIIWVVGIFSFFTIFFSAPVGTKKNPIVNNKHRRYLVKKVRIRLFFITLLICIVPIYIQQFIILGIFIQSVFLLIQLIKGDGK